MNESLKARIARRLDRLSDERGYQILDYIEFLESKYAERAAPTGIFAKVTETVEDVMRAGRLPVKAISGTMGLMDSAGRVMKGVVSAAQSVVDEAMLAARAAPPVPPAAAPPPAAPSAGGADAAPPAAGGAAAPPEEPGNR
jgi:hypothetical protein